MAAYIDRGIAFEREWSKNQTLFLNLEEYPYVVAFFNWEIHT